MQATEYVKTRIESAMAALPQIVATVAERIGDHPGDPKWIFPLLTYRQFFVDDLQPIGQPVAAETLMYDVVITDVETTPQRGTARIRDAAEVMHQALHFTGTIIDGHEVSSMRLRQTQRPTSTEPDGRILRHAGGEYQFFVAPLS